MQSSVETSPSIDGKSRWRRFWRSDAARLGFCILAATTLGGWLAYQRDSGNQHHGGLVVDEAELDLGTVTATDLFRWPIEIQNPTDRSIEVTDFVESCLCSELSPTSFVIGPGASQRVELVIDLVPRSDQVQSAYDFTLDLVPVIPKAFPPPRGWSISARVNMPLFFSRWSAHLGEVPRGQLPEIAERFYVGAAEPLASVDASCDPHVAQVSTVLAEPSESQYHQFTITVVPSASLPDGPFEFAILVRATTSDGRALPPMSLRADGTVISGPRAIPSELRLVAPNVGDIIEQAVELFSDEPVAIAFEAGPSATVHRLHSDPSRLEKRHRFHIQYRCSAPGRQESYIDFVVRGPSGTQETCRVPIIAYGVDQGSTLKLPNLPADSSSLAAPK